MVNIKVPINLKGAIKIDTADIEDRLQVDKSANNDLQFLKNLHDTEKFQLRNNQTTLTATGNIGTITPPNGSTFYLLGATASIRITAGADLSTMALNKNSPFDQREVQAVTGLGVHNLAFNLTTDSLRGDSSQRSYTLDYVQGADVSAEVFGVIWGYLENSVRP